MNFDELGAALRTERERRGLRIEDVADHLKISARHLRALEEGDAAALPHPAYARGFIRSYAAYLGMSPDEIHNALNGVASPETAPQAPVHLSEAAPRGQHSGSGGGGKGAFLILVLLVVAGGVYAGWHWGLPLLSGLEKPRLAQPSPPLTSAQPSPAADAGKSLTRERPAEKARAAEPAPAPAQPPAPAAPAAQRQEEQRPAPEQPQASRTAEPTPSGAQASGATGAPAVRAEAPAQPDGAGAASGDEAAAPGEHKVIITATEECWIHSNADKTDTRQFSLRKGDTFALTFARSLELKLGNAGGVRIRYDGQAMPPAGQSGQVRTVTFPPQDAR